jgi:MFS transporter, PAT family, beta-lactamase induction signal transducer AmpG
MIEPPPAPRASIQTSFPHRLVTLCGLYFAQGVPTGFTTIALVAYLNAEGVSRQQTATLISLALLPWSFKLIWGPIIDSFQLPALGLRRPWIVLAQLGMAATLLAASTSDNLTEARTIGFLAAVFFVHNTFQTLQDVATDAMAMDLLPPNERGRMNGFMWASKLIATSLGGVVFATVLVRWGLPLGVRIQAGLVLAIMLLPLLVRERAGEKLFPWSPGRRMAPAGASVRVAGELKGLRRALAGPVSVVKELWRAFGLRTTAIAAIAALTSIACEGFHDALTPAVFTQTLGWSAEQYSRLQGVWGTLGRILGAVGGGYLCDRVGRRNMMGAGATISALAFAAFGLTAGSWASPGYPLALFIVVIQGSIAMTAVAFFSLAMKISWTGAAATQFTVYMALSNFGYAVGPNLTRLQLDDPASYLAAAAVAFLPVPFLFLLRPDSVEARKHRDQLQRAERAAAA